jgi:DNA-binding NarL/FixJ family response regulator
MDKNSIRVIFVDDDPKALKRLTNLMVNFKKVEIAGQYQNGNEALDAIMEKNLDLVFLDIEMDDITGLEMAEIINKNSPETKIIFTTSFDHYAIKAIKQGAFDYLLKPIGIDELKEALEKYKSQFQLVLSKREREIVRLIAQGYNSEQVGEKLFLSRHTIDTHRRKILEKTGCKNSAELIKYAVNHKLA